MAIAYTDHATNALSIQLCTKMDQNFFICSKKAYTQGSKKPAFF